MLGRISAQKDFMYFASLNKNNTKYKYIWIGGGDEQDEEYLRKNDIFVTGWVERNIALGWLSLADCYVHTAAWDGFPISVLEAAELKKPILLRNISAFSVEGLYVANNINEFLNQIDSALNDFENSLAKKNLKILSDKHNEVQVISALARIYI